VRPRLVILACGGRIESSARRIEWCTAVGLFFPTTEFGIPQPAALWWSGDGWSLHQSAIDDSGTELGIANHTLAQPGEGSLGGFGPDCRVPKQGRASACSIPANAHRSLDREGAATEGPAESSEGSLLRFDLWSTLLGDRREC
jgi:hypothetical protein